MIPKIPHLDQSSNIAALGLVRARLRPQIEQRQRYHRAQYQRILSGGEPPAGLDREYALAWLRSLIRGNHVTLMRIARVEAANDDLPLPAPDFPNDDDRGWRTKAGLSSGPPPPKRQRPVDQNGALIDAQRAKSKGNATSPKYAGFTSRAISAAGPEDFCAFRAAGNSPNKNNPGSSRTGCAVTGGRMQLVEWKRVRKGASLRGFASVVFLGIGLPDVPVHRTAGGQPWAAIPGKPRMGPDGQLIRNAAGKIEYSPVFGFTSKKLREAFSQRVCQLVAEREAGAFEDAS
jgi:hypothetical protein